MTCMTGKQHLLIDPVHLRNQYILSPDVGSNMISQPAFADRETSFLQFIGYRRLLPFRRARSLPRTLWYAGPPHSFVPPSTLFDATELNMCIRSQIYERCSVRLFFSPGCGEIEAFCCEIGNGRMCLSVCGVCVWRIFASSLWKCVGCLGKVVFMLFVVCWRYFVLRVFISFLGFIVLKVFLRSWVEYVVCDVEEG